jgi:Transposase DDE domain
LLLVLRNFQKFFMLNTSNTSTFPFSPQAFSASSDSLQSLLSHPDSLLGRQVFAPLLQGVEQLPSFRVCPDLSDQDWLLFGVLRSLQPVQSGRAFLQKDASLLPACPELSQFFETLKSSRRLAFCSDATAALVSHLTPLLPDALAQFPALAGFEVWAGDGHFHAAAAHDPRDSEGRKHPVGHLFMLNLRTHLVSHLTVCDQDSRLKEHDMRRLKRTELSALRMLAPKSRRVIIVWDRAGIDFRQWHHWKQTGGLYFISREKENMKLEVCGENQWERTDALNAGVIADELCMPSTAGVTIRRVRFQRPDTGEQIAFLTMEMTLPPGLIAELYRRRWDIEKAFDEFKNKFGETKAWATSATAKTMQAQFLCITHNLLLWLDHHMAAEHGIHNVAEDKRRAKRLADLKNVVTAAGRVLPSPWLAIQRATVRSVKLIRWLYPRIFLRLPWHELTLSLAASYASL